MEGLNQEIERIVLKTGGESHCSRSDDYEKFYQITPEGHRAPLPDLFRSTRSRSVNTQTPQDFGGSGHSSGKKYSFIKFALKTKSTLKKFENNYLDIYEKVI